MARRSKVGLASLLGLLASRATIGQAARKLGVSHEAIRKKIKALEAAGRIKAISRSPAFFEVLPENPGEKGDKLEFDGGLVKAERRDLGKPSSSDESRITEPHRVGVVYDLAAGELPPGRTRQVRGTLYRRDWPNLKLEGIQLVGSISPKGATITAWATRFRGLRSKEQLRDARERLRAFLERWAGVRGFKLEFRRFAAPVEYTLPAKHLSEATSDALGLKDGPRKLDGVIYQAETTSHPGRVQFKNDLGSPRFASEIHADKVEALYSQAADLVGLPERMARHEEAIKKIGEAVELLAIGGREEKPAPLPPSERREIF